MNAVRPTPSQSFAQHDASRSGGASLPSPGDVVAGKYRIEHVVGEGGMGVVYAAQHLVLDQRVALKVLVVDSLQGEEKVERFVREARAAARLRSEHVVRVTDAGALDRGLPFLVMEYLQGRDLAELLQADGPLAPETVADHLLQVLAALAEAHAAGIVHRDLKPANLFLAVRSDGSQVVKVLDFGISKQKSERAQWKELTGKAILGTPAYMSPEQLRCSKDVDARADIWSLGVVAYELLTGKLPFDGDGPGEIFAAVLERAPMPLGAHRPGLPPAWDDVVQRCLQRAPDARFADVAELARAIAPLATRPVAPLLAAVEGALARPAGPSTYDGGSLVRAAVAAAVTSLPPPLSPRALTDAGIAIDGRAAADGASGVVAEGDAQPGHGAFGRMRRALARRGPRSVTLVATAVSLAVLALVGRAPVGAAARTGHADAGRAREPTSVTHVVGRAVTAHDASDLGDARTERQERTPPAAPADAEPPAGGGSARSADHAFRPAPAGASARLPRAAGRARSEQRPQFLKSWR